METILRILTTEIKFVSNKITVTPVVKTRQEVISMKDVNRLLLQLN